MSYRRKDPMHTSVCAVCYQPTWYSPERIALPETDPHKRPFVTDPDRWLYGNRAHEHGLAGAMNLKVIDRSALAPAFAGYYESGDRVRVRFSYGEEMTGTIGKTTGWRPCYLLMRRSNSMGSPWTLGDKDIVVAVKRGRNYVTIRP